MNQRAALANSYPDEPKPSLKITSDAMRASWASLTWGSYSGLDLSPFLRQTVKTQNSANGIKMPLKGGLSHGFVSTAVYEGVQAGGDPAVGAGGVARGGGASV